MATDTKKTGDAEYIRQPVFYDKWMESQGIPIYRDYYIEDGRTIELGHWAERGHDAAFLQLAGQEGVSESRISEVPPGGSIKPFKFALEEVVYVLSGRGVATVWAESGEKRSFEWTARSMFVIPANHWVEYSNMAGDAPARLLSYNNLPIAMSTMKDPGFFFNNPYTGADEDASFYSEAVVVEKTTGLAGRVRNYWVGNFFPDLGAWDRLVPFKGRGAGGTTVFMQFPGSELTAHMSVFPSRTYKKGHRHGPAFVIVIPSGEGFSVMWKDGEEKVFIPWHEGSIFVPPNRWFHQHFNVGGEPGRYFAFHPLPQLTGTADDVNDIRANQFEYHEEDPAIRQTFEAELAKRGLTSAMPPECYTDPDFLFENEKE